MKKGQKKRKWTVEQKLKIIHKHLDEHISVRTLAKEYETDSGMICRWTKEYLADGEAGLRPKASLSGKAGMITVAINNISWAEYTPGGGKKQETREQKSRGIKAGWGYIKPAARF